MTTVAATNAGSRLFAWGHLEVCGKGVIRLADRPTPVEFEVDGGLSQGETIVSVAAARQHAVVASSNGRVWTWGRGRAGRLGHGKDKEQIKLKVYNISPPSFLFCC